MNIKYIRISNLYESNFVETYTHMYIKYIANEIRTSNG